MKLSTYLKCVPVESPEVYTYLIEVKQFLEKSYFCNSLRFKVLGYFYDANFQHNYKKTNM
jgi:hypothetical protein